MRTILQLTIVFVSATSCGLVKSDQRILHDQYSGILTNEDKRILAETGELFKDVEHNDPERNVFIKGRLRVLKTEQDGIFNFVQVGQWIDQARYGNSGPYHNLEFRDTVTYDNNGNTTCRIVYDKKYGTFQMIERWTGEIINERFIQRMSVYDKGILIAEYSRKVVDYLTPKSDLEKNKIPYGEDKEYKNGNVSRVKTYDTNGKIISDEKYGR